MILLSSIPQVYSLNTYTFSIKIIDENNNPICESWGEPWIVVTTQYGIEDYRSSEKQPNASGVAVFTVQSILPSAQVRVYWCSVEVAYEEVNLSKEGNNFTIQCAVSDLNVSCVDYNDRALKGAKVKLFWQVDIPWTTQGTTNNQGLALFHQLPYYAYEIKTYWQDKLVYHDTFSFTNLIIKHVARCAVYDLIINVFDKEDRSISGAGVTITRSGEWTASKVTDNGTVSFLQLAFGNYSIQASYQSTSNVTSVKLTQNSELSLKLNISVPRAFQITVQVVWTDEKPVVGAYVVIRENGETIRSTGLTNANGLFSVSLTEGTYTVYVSKNELSRLQDVTLKSDITITMWFNASLRKHTLTVNVEDAYGAPIEGAVVEVYSNEVLMSNSETIAGRAIFEVADGTYTVVVKVDSKQREETVDILTDKELLITFQAETSFDTFSLIIIMVVAISAIFLVVLFYRKRSQKTFDFKDLERQAKQLYENR